MKIRMYGKIVLNLNALKLILWRNVFVFQSIVVAEDHNINLTVIEWLCDIQSCLMCFLPPKTQGQTPRSSNLSGWLQSYDCLKVLEAFMVAIQKHFSAGSTLVKSVLNQRQIQEFVEPGRWFAFSAYIMNDISGQKKCSQQLV